jgi:hypothetical protein
MKFLGVWSPAFSRPDLKPSTISSGITVLCRKLLVTLLLGGIILIPMTEAWAHLPKPIEMQGTVLAVDTDTHTLVFKHSKEEKPMLLDWNKKTMFSRDGRAVCFDALKPGYPVLVQYRNVSFHSPLLLRVSWNSQN